MNRFLSALLLVVSLACPVWAGQFQFPGQALVRSTHPGQFAPATTGTSVLLGNGTGGFSLLGGNTLAAHNFATQITAVGALAGAQPTAGDIAGGTFTGAFTFSSAPTLSSITGSTQPLQVNSSGLIAGAGAFGPATTSATAMTLYGGL